MFGSGTLRAVTNFGRSFRGERAWADLLELPYFAGLSRPLLESASQQADRFTVSAGTRLDRRGFRARYVWLPLDDALELRIDGHRCGEIPAGGVANETAVLQSLHSPCDVVTVSDTAVVSLPSRSFHGLLADDWFAEQVAARVRGDFRSELLDVRAPTAVVALAVNPA